MKPCEAMKPAIQPITCGPTSQNTFRSNSSMVLRASSRSGRAKRRNTSPASTPRVVNSVPDTKPATWPKKPIRTSSESAMLTVMTAKTVAHTASGTVKRDEDMHIPPGVGAKPVCVE